MKVAYINLHRQKVTYRGMCFIKKLGKLDIDFSVQTKKLEKISTKSIVVKSEKHPLRTLLVKDISKL